MAQTATEKIVLMSIHPEFVNAILLGTKKVEFRKTKFASKVSHVVVYATTPIKKVVCVFEVSKIVIEAPANLWEMYSDVAGICKERFLTYYEKSDYGVAIEVGLLRKFKEQLSLSDLGDVLTPPQSYQYLDRKVFDRLEGRMLVKSKVNADAYDGGNESQIALH